MFIVDTHALLWYLRDSAELSARAHDSIIPQYQVSTVWQQAFPNESSKFQIATLTKNENS